MVQDLVLRMKPVADMNDLDLVFSADGPAGLQADQILLQSAVRNVLDNALKYAPSEGQITIGVRGGATVELTICDDGPGFPNHEMADLTTRFRRGNNAQGTIGSGLGLTIAHDVVAAHGGQMTLSNADGGGACVTFSF